MSGVRGQARVENACDTRIGRQPLGQLQCGCALGSDAQIECLEAAAQQECIEGTQYRSGGVLDEIELLKQLLIAHDQCAAEQVAMASQILGGGMHDDVGPEFQWSGERRRGERVVDTQQRAVLVRQVSATAMSVIDIRGLPGLSIHTSRVWGVICWANESGSVLSCSETRIPARSTILCSKRYVPP